MSNTTRVGLLAIISIGILIWGYTFLKGKNLFNRSTQIYVQYDQVDGLTTSAPVKVNGFKVGIVSKVYLKEDYSGKIIVVLDLSEALSISKKGAVARIESSSLMGGKQVVLKFPKGICQGDDCLESGDTIRGEVVSLIGSMTSDLDPYIEQAERTFEAIDSMVQSWGTKEGAENGIGRSINDVQEVLSNLNATSRNLKILMAASTGRIDGVLANLEAVSANLKASNDDILATLKNTAAFTEQLKAVDINSTLGNADNAIVDLQKTLTSIDAAVTELSGVLEKANKGEGSLGLLLTNDNLYQDVDRTMLNLSLLLEDLRLNPARYTRVLSKKRTPYEAPNESSTKSGN